MEKAKAPKSNPPRKKAPRILKIETLPEPLREGAIRTDKVTWTDGRSRLFHFYEDPD